MNVSSTPGTSGTVRAIALAASLAVSTATILTTPATARQCDTTVLTWVGGSKASVLDPASWSPPVVPDGDTTIVFEDFAPVGGFLSDDLTVARVVLRGGPTSFRLSLAAFLAEANTIGCPALAIGGPGPAQLLLRPTDEREEEFRVASASIGTSDGAGLLRAEFPSQFTHVRVDGKLVVGDVADGEIRELERLTAGTLTVGHEGPGRLDFVELASIAGLATIGDNTLGEADRTSIEAGELVLGGRQDGTGDVLLRSGQTLMVAGRTEVGARGRGLLRVVEASADIGGDLLIGAYAIGEFPGFFDRGDGFVSVSGAGSTLLVGGDLAIGLLGHAELEVFSDAAVAVAGSITTNTPGGIAFADQRLTLRLEEPDGTDAILAAGGSITLPELEVRFAPGFTPELGDAWTLVQSDTALALSPVAPPTFPLLPAGLAWSVLEDGQQLVASVIEVGASSDIDGDGVVGLGDLLAVLSAYGRCPAGDPCPADLDGSGTVDFLDLVRVLADWS